MQQKHGRSLLPKCDLNDATDSIRSDLQTVEHIKLEPEQRDEDDRTGDYDCMDYEEADRVMDDSVDTDEPSYESEDDSSYTNNCKTKRNKTPMKSPKQKKLRMKRVSKDGTDSNNKALTELIAKYITAKCDKCTSAENAQRFTTLEDANEHHLTFHDQPGYLLCCDKRLSSKQQLKQHLSWHNDQNKFK